MRSEVSEASEGLSISNRLMCESRSSELEMLAHLKIYQKYTIVILDLSGNCFKKTVFVVVDISHFREALHLSLCFAYISAKFVNHYE